MTPLNPDWTQLKQKPYAPYLPDEALQYRSDEIARIETWKEAHPLSLPVEIEIGSNRGRFLLGLARARRDVSFVGLELKESLCRLSENKCARENLSNAFVVHADAKLALPVLFAPATLSAIYVLFPDPWWKKKHAQRRLLDDDFFAMAHLFLKPGGFFMLKTDVLDYFEAVQAYLETNPNYTFSSVEAIPGSESWEMSTRERHCVEDGVPFRTLVVQNVAGETARDLKTTLTEATLVKHNYRYHPQAT